MHKKSIFRATAILSSSSIINMLLSLVTAKVLALQLQPAGYGFYGLLQSFVGVATLVIGLGLTTAIVHHGAAAASNGDQLAFGSLRRAAWLIFVATSIIAVIALAIFRTQISIWALGTATQGSTILLMSIALIFTVAGNIQMGILNAYHRVGALAKYAVVNTAVGAVITVGFVWVWQIRGVAPALIAVALCGWLVGRYFLHREVPSPALKLERSEVIRSVAELLRFGGPYTASMLMGTGTQLILPMIVLHMLNADSVGYYRAAFGISVGYLGFLVTAMAQDYYPRVAAAAGNAGMLARLVNEQQRLILLLSGPMILGTLALVPYLVPFLYSLKFRPTVEILEWQLVGDVFKFSSWTMSFMILARCKTTVYFLIESIGGIAMLTTTYVGVKWFGLTGLGVSFVAAYIIYFFAVWLISRREINLRWSPGNKKMMLVTVGAVFLVRIISSTRFAMFRTPVALALALAIGTFSFVILWREFIASKAAIASAVVPAEIEAAASTT